MPFFSIVIPTYNRAYLLSKVLDSVFAQVFEDFEILLVDDGSTDDTKNLVAHYTDLRLNYIYQENGERGKARNTGVKNALGKYVFFLDSDDLIYPNHLEHAFEEIHKHNLPAFFHSRYELVYADKTVQQPTLNQSTINQNILVQNLFACQFFLKREIALKFPFSENRALKIGEDWAVILHVAHHFPLYISNTTTSAIVIHDGRSMELASAEEIKISRDLLIEDLKRDAEIPTKVHGNVFAEFTTLMALSFAIENKKSAALKNWWKGISNRPNQIFKRRTLAIFKKIILNGKA